MAGRRDIEAGRAFMRLFLKNDLTKQLSGALSGVGKQLQSTGRQVGAVGAGIAGAGAAILAPLAASVKHFAAAGDQLDKMSQRTGVAAPALAEFGFAAEQSGTDLNKVENSVRRMQKTIGDANRGLSTATEGLGRLGLSAQELNGMAPEDQFQLIADRLKEIEDPTAKASAAMDVFGSRTGTAILPMLDSLGELRQEARELGIVPTDKAVKDAAAVTDAINRLKRSVMATAFEIGASLADEVLAAAAAAKKIAVQIGRWIRDNVGLVKTIAAVGIGLAAAGAAVVALGGGMIFAGLALAGLASIVSALGAAVGLLFSPLGAVAALLVGGTVLWARYTESGRNAIASLRQGLGEIMATAKETFGGIADALAAGDLQLAGEIAFTGLKLAALQGLEAIRGLVGDAVAGIVMKLASGDISGAWSDTLIHLSALWATWSEGVIKTFTAMGQAVINGWNKVVSFISGKILELASTPGFNALFEFVSGVDVRAEIERGKRLGVKDPLADAKGFAAESVAARADAMIAELERINQAAAAATRDASGAAAAASEESMSAFAEAASEARARLDALRKKAAAARSEADKERKEKAAETGGGAGGIARGIKSDLVTFSAAAAVAGGFGGGGGPLQQMAKDWAAVRRQLEGERQQRKEHVRLAKAMKTELERLAIGLSYR